MSAEREDGARARARARAHLEIFVNESSRHGKHVSGLGLPPSWRDESEKAGAEADVLLICRCTLLLAAFSYAPGPGLLRSADLA